MSNGVVILVDTIFAIFKLIVACIIIYIIYYIFSTGYPRPFVLGHSEPIVPYMVSFMREFLTSLKKASVEVPSIEDFFAAADTLQEAMTGEKLDLFTEAEGPNIPSGKARNLTPERYPALYMIFMFYRAIGDDALDELAYMNKFFKANHVKMFYEPGSTTKIKGSTLEPLKKLREAFDKVRENVAKKATELREKSIDDVNAKIAVYMLDRYINEYINRITRIYDFRKSGGRAFIIYHLYMEEYKQYVFVETLRPLWNFFGQEVKDNAVTLQKLFSSPAVQKTIENIPFKIAGIERFEQEEEVVEHFIGPLKAIAKTFVALLDIVLAIVKVIEMMTNNPMALFRFLIGLIIGVIIYVLYTLILLLSFLFYIPSFVYVVFTKLAVTLIWTLVFVMFAVFYGILSLLDNVTGGVVLGMFRCENLPDSWHTRPGYAKDNVFKRNFLCAYRCASRYYPDGWMCKKMPKYEPAFCPHQLIFNAAYSATYDPLEKNPYIHQYKPTAAYYFKEKFDKAMTWGNVFDNRRSFNEACTRSMAPYDHIVQELCSKVYTEAQDPKNNNSMKSKNPKQYAQVLELCKVTYCNNETYKDKKFSFCADTSQNNDQKQLASDDIIAQTILNATYLLLFIVAGSVVYTIVQKE